MCMFTSALRDVYVAVMVVVAVALSRPPLETLYNGGKARQISFPPVI